MRQSIWLGRPLKRLSPVPMDENYLACSRGMIFLSRMPFAVRDLAPKSSLGIVIDVPWSQLTKAAGFHHFKVARELPIGF